MRLRYRILGGHVHCRVFTGTPGYTFAKCGDLTFSIKEWPQVLVMLEMVDDIEVVLDTETERV